jgi:hypothetical protein
MKDERGRDTDDNAGGDLPQRAGEDARQQSPRPRAVRMPISRRRRVTAKDMRAYNPAADRTSTLSVTMARA